MSPGLDRGGGDPTSLLAGLSPAPVLGPAQVDHHVGPGWSDLSDYPSIPADGRRTLGFFPLRDR